MKLNPYLLFSGNAEEALNFYKESLGGEISGLQRFGDTPTPGHEIDKNKIMHARLTFDDNLIMVSDGSKESPSEGNVQLSVDVENADQLETVFSKMAEGGKIDMPLQDTFWGARFGMLTDKFGIHWMFNQEKKK